MRLSVPRSKRQGLLHCLTFPVQAKSCIHTAFQNPFAMAILYITRLVLALFIATFASFKVVHKASG